MRHASISLGIYVGEKVFHLKLDIEGDRNEILLVKEFLKQLIKKEILSGINLQIAEGGNL